MHHDRSHVTRVLTVADWTVDPEAVVAAMSRQAELQPTVFGLLVPAWLHGLDWAGDPTAVLPCAHEQLDTLELLCGRAGLLVGAAWVGDPDPVTAAGDALRVEWPAEQVLLYTAPRRFPAPPGFDLDARIHRITGVPVTRSQISRPRVLGRRRGHCSPSLT
jgi:hypothetical protein